MPEDILASLLEAREQGTPCALATVVATRGSIPREPGAKAIIFADSRIVGTVGGGKFESLVIADAITAIGSREPILKSYPLHEHSAESFGAICGGEVTVFIEPQLARESLVIVGAGHCARAICKLARECGFHITVLDDRPDILSQCDAHTLLSTPAPDFIAARQWRSGEALIIVSRNYNLDREALAAALAHPGAAYLGMIGSIRKVTRVFEELRARGISEAVLASVHAPIGLDIGADSPPEIAVSVIAEVLQVLRARPGGHLRPQRT